MIFTKGVRNEERNNVCQYTKVWVTCRAEYKPGFRRIQATAMGRQQKSSQKM